MDETREAGGVVIDFCEAFGKHDASLLRPFFTDDVLYHNIPMDPCVGIEETISFIEGFFAMCSALTIEMVHMAVHDNVVLTERIDTFTVGEVTAPLLVMGTFELRGSKISAWRDYFDLAQIASVFAGEG